MNYETSQLEVKSEATKLTCLTNVEIQAQQSRAIRQDLHSQSHDFLALELAMVLLLPSRIDQLIWRY